MSLKFGLIMTKLHKGAKLPDNHHILRHHRKNRLMRSPDGSVNGIFPQAFSLREGEQGISVGWIEYFNEDVNIGSKESILHYRESMNVNDTCAFSLLNVQKAKDICAEIEVNIRVQFLPTALIKNHAEIRDYPRDNGILNESLAIEAFKNLIFNKDIA